MCGWFIAIWLSLCAAIFVVAYLLGLKQLTGIDIREVDSGQGRRTLFPNKN
ncbi:hypothetical protein [Nostoc sp. FACHB-280]|uniref:hypothetical protein n=1 Tax=Nostoc sp. FACHB-280 TaxID=2692839 RepID=UPI0018EFB9CD